MGSGEDDVRIALLGELVVTRGGEVAKLPQSKKTRALLAYLALTGKAHRRDRLIRLLWDVTDDPRGALRWSLSKLRRVVDSAELKRLVADRESAGLDRALYTMDLDEVEAVIAELPDASVEALEAAAAMFRGELLEGLELDDFLEFGAWLVTQRERARKARAAITDALVARLADEPERALGHARALVAAEPATAEFRLRLVELLVKTGRREEALKHVEAGERLAREMGDEPPRELRVALAAPSSEAERPAPAPRALPTPHLAAPAFKSTVHGMSLFGRERELAHLAGRLEAARDDGAQRVVLLTGEPGVGKTRLLVEMMIEARSRRGTTVEGAAYEVEQARPFGPWIDALRRQPSKAIAAAGLGGLLDSEGPLDRSALHDAVARFLLTRAREKPPLLLALDDLQWFDEASASLLHYVVRATREAPVLVLLAARGGELVDNPAALRTVRALRNKRRLEGYELGPLEADAIESLTKPLKPALEPEQLFRESGGNPLYALELARATPYGQSVPHSLGQLVRDRVERLPGAAETTLRWAAVLGATFSVSRLAEVLPEDGEDLLDVLEALERHALIGAVVDLSDPGGKYQFAHELVRRVVYADLSLPRARLMHRRVASHLAKTSNLGLDGLLDLAHHAAVCGDAVGAARACADAAERCLEIGAPAEALRHAGRGSSLAHNPSAEAELRDRLTELATQARKATETRHAPAE